VKDIHLINWTIQEARVNAERREPIDLDAIPSLDQLLAWPAPEPAKVTNTTDSFAEIAPIQMTAEELAVARPPRETDDAPKLTVNKITWAQVGLVAEPGRYMFKFGWLTITEDDLVVWKQYPNAAFTLVRTATTIAEADEEVAENYRLGTFELRENLSFNER
jgi:hypothetical protein